MTQFDDVFEYIGELGRYQLTEYFLLCLPVVFVAAQTMNFMFVSYVPDHRFKAIIASTIFLQCRVVKLDSYELSAGVDNKGVNDSLRKFYDSRLPLETDPYMSPEHRYDRCKMYVNRGKNVTTCQDGYVFSRDIMQTTLVEDAELVCDRLILHSISKLTFFFGILLGALVCGYTSDRFGRKKTFYFSLVFMFVFGVASSFSRNLWLYSFFKCITGFASSGIYIPVFILALELIGPSWRSFAGLMMQNFWSFGLILLSITACVIPNWQWIQLVTSIPIGGFLLYHWAIPESARWLMAMGRMNEVKTVLRHAAKTNKTKIPESFFQELETDTSNVKDNTLLDLFRSKTWALRTANVAFNWFGVAMAYYGLTTNVSSLGGNLFLNTIINSLVEFPANIASIFVINKVGRKLPYLFGMSLVSSGCLIFFLLEFVFSGKQHAKNNYSWLFLTCYFIGKFGSTIAFNIVYIWTAEIFPTVVRTAGVGLSAMLARIGTMLSPYIVDLAMLSSGPWKRALPLLIFGCVASAAGATGFFLPETLGAKLPVTIEEGKFLGKKSEHSTENEKQGLLPN